MSQKLNKGEWSEAYCLLNTMATQKLILCDDSLSDIGAFIKVVGGQLSTSLNYRLKKDKVLFIREKVSQEMPISDIYDISQRCLQEIQKPQDRTFSIEAVEKLFRSLGESSLKAKSCDKADSILHVSDGITNQVEKLGFSIKSFLAGSPTLVNAGKTTNFIYKVDCKFNDYEGLKAKVLVRSLFEDNLAIKFIRMESDVYHKNLTLVDTQLPIMLSEILKIYYSSREKTISSLVDTLVFKNPLKLKDTSIYRNKISDYLFYSATGMFPNTPWEGIQDIDGGCMIVKETGEIKTFYIFRKEFMHFFRKYLFEKCFLDTASTTRHKFGRIYKEKGEVRLNLNLQIRIAR